MKYIINLKVLSLLFIVLSLSVANINKSDNKSDNKSEDKGDNGNIYIFVNSNVLPYAVIVPLIVLFNINLVSGPGHSFLFFYQTLWLAEFNLKFVNSSNHSKTAEYAYMASNITAYLSLLEVPPRVVADCDTEDISKQDHCTIYIATGYGKVLLILVYLAIIWILIQVRVCPILCCSKKWAKIRRSVRNLRKKYIPRGSPLNGTVSVLLICYGYLVQTTFRLIARGKIRHCDMENMAAVGTCILQKTAIAIASLLLLFPLTLLYYPNLHNILSRITQRITNKSLPRYAKLDPVFDTFQGCYKPKLRFFAGLYMVYRLVLWTTVPVMVKPTDQAGQYIITMMFLAILTVHSLMQPFRKAEYNYVETINLLALVFLSSLTGFLNAEAKSSAVIGSCCYNLIQPVSLCIILIAFLPLAIAIIYCSYYNFKWHCSRMGLCCQERRRRDSEEGVAYRVPPEDKDSFDLLAKDGPEVKNTVTNYMHQHAKKSLDSHLCDD